MVSGVGLFETLWRIILHCWTYTTVDLHESKGDLCHHSSLHCDKNCDFVLIYLAVSDHL